MTLFYIIFEVFVLGLFQTKKKRAMLFKPLSFRKQTNTDMYNLTQTPTETCAHCANFRRTSYRSGGQCRVKKKWSVPLGYNLCADVEADQAACDDLLLKETRQVLITINLGLDVDATMLNDGRVTFAIDRAVITADKNRIDSETSRYVTLNYGPEVAFRFEVLPEHDEEF